MEILKDKLKTLSRICCWEEVGYGLVLAKTPWWQNQFKQWPFSQQPRYNQDVIGPGSIQSKLIPQSWK